MILNFFFDFILLLSVSIILRRNVSIYKIMLGAFIGGISVIFLFLKVSNLSLFIYKIIISILMIITSFGYKNIRYTFKNFLFLYSASIILGGFLYFLNIQFSYSKNGLVFFNSGLSINVVFLIIFCPIIIYIYIKQSLWLKNNYSNYYKVDLFHKDKVFHLTGFMDTGNKLVDIYTKKPIILVDIPLESEYYYYVPYKGVNKDGLIKCIKIEKMIINKKEYRSVVVGILEQKIKIDGVDCLLNSRLKEKI